LQLKAQALEVSDDQVIAQAMRALRIGSLHSHLVREWSKTAMGLYGQFTKFNKSEIKHFCKLEQQKKLQSQTKPQGPLATMTANAAIPSQYTALILTAADHQRIVRKKLGHLCKKET
jgi:hypothetical protein